MSINRKSNPIKISIEEYNLFHSNLFQKIVLVMIRKASIFYVIDIVARCCIDGALQTLPYRFKRSTAPLLFP